jgi:hypothetical protein
VIRGDYGGKEALGFADHRKGHFGGQKRAVFGQKCPFLGKKAAKTG